MPVGSSSSSPSDPAAAYLRWALLDYAAGDQFRPRTKVEVEKLPQILELDVPPAPVKPKTDEAFDARGQLPPKRPKGGRP